MNDIKQKHCVDEVTGDFSAINDFIDQFYPGRKDCLIQILHTAQELYGYLPAELQQFIAKKLDIPVSEIAGVVTFSACYVRGGKKLIDHLLKKLEIEVGETTEDGLFTFEIARCIGACGLAPAIMIDDDVFKQVTPAKLDAILAGYKD